MEGFYPKLNALLYVHVHVCFSAFQSGGVDLSQPIVFTCGGAMVAPLVAFSLHLTGLSAPVYDVSYELLLLFILHGHTFMQKLCPSLH